MSKKNLMKSVIAMVVVAGFVLSLSSCQKDEKKIVGKWKMEKMEITELACSDPLMSVMLKPMVEKYLAENTMSGHEMEFTKDGKVIADGKQVATYKVSNSKLTVTSEGVDNTLDISFSDKKTMQWKQNASKEDREMLSEAFSMLFDEEVEVTKYSTCTTFKKQ